MLIQSARHRPEDLAIWREHEEADRIHGGKPELESKAERSVEAITRFVAEPCYAGISWGKDSTVMAHLIRRAGASIPFVWIKQPPAFNPDCESVRDAFLSRFLLDYHEIVSWLRPSARDWHATGTLETGFREAEQRFGDRHISGIRAEESGGRKIRMRNYGLTSQNACAPLGWWTEQDVFGYLAHRDLPVHPCYAMLGAGRWPRNQIRTCRLDGKGGSQFGRAEWEQEYYGDVIRKLHCGTNHPVLRSAKCDRSFSSG